MKKNSALSVSIVIALLLCLCSAFLPMMSFAENTGATEGGISVYTGSPNTDWTVDSDGIYRIRTAADLAQFAAQINAGTNFSEKTVLLETDIVWNDGNASDWANGNVPSTIYNWSCGVWGKVFSGTFDGQGHTISGLYLNETDDNNGLFAVAGTGAKVCNLRLVNSYFVASKGYMGSVFGNVNGTNVVVENVYSDAILTSSASLVGGIAGRVNGSGQTITIKNCVFSGDITGSEQAGGIFGGTNRNTVIQNCLNLGTVTVSGSTAGGIVGYYWGGTHVIQNCVNLGTVNASSAKRGILGNCKSSTVTLSNNLYNNALTLTGGTIATETGNVGMSESEIRSMTTEELASRGLTQWCARILNGLKTPLPSAFEEAFSDSFVSVWDGTSVSEGLKTNSKGEYLIQSAADLKYFADQVNAGNHWSGKVVLLTTDIVWNEGDSSEWLAQPPANSWLCGSWNCHFAGTFDGQGHTISGLYTKVSGDGAAFFSCVGGTSAIKNLAITNSVFSGKRFAGGLISLMRGSNTVTVESVYVDATVVGTGIATGGLIGNAHSSTTVTVKNAVFSGSVSGTNMVGGIVGGNQTTGQARKLTMVNVLNLGTVSGSSNVGGLVGYYDSTTAGMPVIQNSMNLGAVSSSGGTAGEIYGTLTEGTATTGITNNIYDSSKSFNGAGTVLDGNLGKTADEISVLTAEDLSAAGLTEWTVATVYGTTGPVPSAIEDMGNRTLDEKVDQLLSTIVGTNYLTKEEIEVLSPMFKNITLTQTAVATTESGGAFEFRLDLGNGIGIERIFSVQKIPTIQYSFASEIPYDAEGVLTVTFSEGYGSGTYGFTWGTESEISDRYAIVALSGDGTTLTYNIRQNVIIPDGITHLWLTLDGTPVCNYGLSKSGEISLGKLKYVYGITADTHFGKSGVDANGAFTKLMNVLDAAGSEFVSIVGDFTNNGYDSHYKNFTNTWTAGGWQMPVFVCTGNHDALAWNVGNSTTPDASVATLKETIETYANPNFTGENGEYRIVVSEENPMYDYAVYYKGDLYLYMGIGAWRNDTNDNNWDQHLDPSQWEWCDAVLSDYYNSGETYGRAYLMFHYPLWQAGMSDSRSALADVAAHGVSWCSSDELIKVLSKYPNLIHFSGHTHYRTYKPTMFLTTTMQYKWVSDVTYEPCNEPLGYTAVHVPSSMSESGGYAVSVYENGVLLTCVSGEDEVLTSYFFIPNDMESLHVRVNDGYIQYVKGYGEWQNLADVTKLSDNEIEVQLSETHVQYREVGAEAWIDLIAMDEIDGEMIFSVDVTLSATVNGKDADVQLIDKDGNVIETVTSVDGVATFTTLALEDGVYTYTMKQNATNGGGWFYDSNEYTITVTVADGVATVEGEAVFTNTDRIPFVAGTIQDVNGVLTYVSDETGKGVEQGLVKIGNDYYYAGPNGVLVTGKYYAWRLNENCDIDKGTYTFSADGRAIVNGIFDGYYYENGKKTDKGLFEYNGAYYVSQYDGKIITGKYYVWKTQEGLEYLNEAWRYFADDGKLLQGIYEHPDKNGLYYFENGVVKEMGLFKYTDGNYYISQWDGKIITSENYTNYGVGKYYVWKIHESASEIATGWYYFGADGAMLQGICEHPDKGGLYYFENGKVKEMGLFEYEGNYYVAQYDGKIITSENYTTNGAAGKYYVWKIHESANEIKAGWYFFDETGKMITE